MENEVEEELYSRSFRLEHYVSNHGKLLELPPVFEVVETPGLRPEIIKDTLIYDPSQDEMELFKELSTFRHINGKNYRITVRTMVVESQGIIFIILVYFLVSLLLFFLIQFYLNRAWNRKIWKSFFHNLEEMKAFSLQTKIPVALQDSQVREFSELKDEIENLTNKVISDYENLKQFTENVSHELQTSLAIMQAKLENFLNESTITEGQFVQLSSLQRDIQRLARLNKKLVLLTNLENKAVVNSEEIIFNKLVEELVENFKELSTVPINLIEEDEIVLHADRELIQVLIQNLIGNALKYSDGKPGITVFVKEKSFVVSNPGNEKLEDGNRLFHRFYKAKNNVEKSTGLGLAIVKKICDIFGYKLLYSFRDQHHFFEIIFT